MSKKHGRRAGNFAERQMVRNLDLLSEYDDYVTDVIPILRQAVKEGWNDTQIYSHPKIKALMAARKISIGLTDKSSAVALSAIKDYEDREKGKAIERRDVKVALEGLSDDQLDSRLQALLGETSSESSSDSDSSTDSIDGGTKH